MKSEWLSWNSFVSVLNFHKFVYHNFMVLSQRNRTYSFFLIIPFIVSIFFSCVWIFHISHGENWLKISHLQHTHDCCPQGTNHEEHIRESSYEKWIQKFLFDPIDTPKLQRELRFSITNLVVQKTVWHYRWPTFDKQSFFFTDTIRLLT